MQKSETAAKAARCYFFSASAMAFSRARIVLRPLRDTILGRNGYRLIVLNARVADVIFLLVNKSAAEIGGSIGWIDTGGLIVVGERAVEIAVLLVDVGAVVVTFDIMRFDSNRNAVVGQRGVQLALLLLPTAARAIDGGQRLFLAAIDDA
jgi:hypothetical protein